jgi:hypothetical protein
LYLNSGATARNNGEEMKTELNELLAKLWMCEKRDFIGYRDAVFALFDRAVAASVQGVPQDCRLQQQVEQIRSRMLEKYGSLDFPGVLVMFGCECFEAGLAASPLPAPVMQQPSRNEVLEAFMESDEFRTAAVDALAGLWTCGRVWSAWGVGTMTQDDFLEASESDECIEQVMDAFKAAIRAMKNSGGANG